MHSFYTFLNFVCFCLMWLTSNAFEVVTRQWFSTPLQTSVSRLKQPIVFELFHIFQELYVLTSYKWDRCIIGLGSGHTGPHFYIAIGSLSAAFSPEWKIGMWIGTLHVSFNYLHLLKLVLNKWSTSPFGSLLSPPSGPWLRTTVTGMIVHSWVCKKYIQYREETWTNDIWRK